MQTVRVLAFVFLVTVLTTTAEAQDGGLLADFLSEGSTTDLDFVLSSLGSKGVGIVRTELDMVGDGEPELFLARRDSWTRFSGFQWRVYEIGDGGSFRFLGELPFHKRSIRVVGPSVLNVLQSPDKHKWWSIEYRVTGTGIEAAALVEGVETDAEIAEENRALAEFWRRQPRTEVWAVVSERGLGPWRDEDRNRLVTGLRPIVGEAHRIDAPGLSQRAATLIGHLEEHRPCPYRGCEIYLEVADLSGDGDAEIRLNTSHFTGYPRLVYTRRGSGWQFLGELPSGALRIDSGGRLRLLDHRARKVLSFTVASGEISATGEISAEENLEEWGREREAILRSPAAGDPFDRYRIAWSAASANPESPLWLTFEAREPAEVGIRFSSPVVNPEKIPLSSLEVREVGRWAEAPVQDSSVLAHFLSEGRKDPTEEALSEVSGHRKLIRRDFDLTGDGLPEVFLSERGMRSRAEGWLWQVYDVSDPARFRYLGRVHFHERHVRVTAPGELRALHQGGSLSRIWVVDYRWTGFEIVEVRRTLLEDGPELTAEQLETKRFQERLPEWAPWAELTSRGLGPWIDPSTKAPVPDLAPIVPQRFTVSPETSAKRSEPPAHQ